MFHIVFFSPKIPANTGNAIRMVACTGATLHLVEPLGFDLSDAKLRRAGLDYHDLAAMLIHESWSALLNHLERNHPGARIFTLTTRASTSYVDRDYQAGDVFVFGPEPDGLPAQIIDDEAVTESLTIPMLPGRRSLNLSNSAAIVAYEAWRQFDFKGWREI